MSFAVVWTEFCRRVPADVDLAYVLAKGQFAQGATVEVNLNAPYAMQAEPAGESAEADEDLTMGEIRPASAPDPTQVPSQFRAKTKVIYTIDIALRVDLGHLRQWGVEGMDAKAPGILGFVLLVKQAISRVAEMGIESLITSHIGPVAYSISEDKRGREAKFSVEYEEEVNIGDRTLAVS